MKDIISNDCEDCGIQSLRFLTYLLKDFSGTESEKVVAREKTRELFEILRLYFCNVESSYVKRKCKEEVKLKDSLTKLREIVSLLNDLVKPYFNVLKGEIEKIIEKQIELISNMKKMFKANITYKKDSENRDEVYDSVDIEQLLNYLYIIRFLIEIEMPNQQIRDSKEPIFKDIISKHNQLLFKRILFIVKLNVQYDEVKEHSFICLSRIISVSSKDFDSLIVKKFKILFDEKKFIGEGIRSLLTLNKGYGIIITFINIGKTSGKFIKDENQPFDYISYLVIKLLNIIQNISAARSETTKKALETLNEFIEGLNNEGNKDLLIAIIESFAHLFETLRKKCKAIYQYSKEAESHKKEMSEYSNAVFEDYLKKSNTDLQRPQPPNIYEENLILSGNIGIFIEWDSLEEFTLKLHSIIKLIITCLTTTVVKLSLNKPMLSESDLKHLIKLFRKGVKLIIEIKLQITKEVSEQIEGDIYEILKNFIYIFVKLPLQSFTKLYSELASFIIKEYLQLKSPANQFLLNVSLQIRDEKKIEKSIQYTIRYACCLFNQIIKDYKSLVQQVEKKEYADQNIFHSIIKYCLTSLERIASITPKERTSDFNNYIICSMAQMFTENMILTKKLSLSKLESSLPNSIISISSIKYVMKTISTLKEVDSTIMKNGDFSAFLAGFIPVAKSISSRSKIVDSLDFITSFPATEAQILPYMPDLYDTLIDHIKQQTFESIKIATSCILKHIDQAYQPQILSKFTSDILNYIERAKKSITMKQNFESLRQAYDCLRILGVGPLRSLIYQDKEFKSRSMTDEGVKIEMKEKSTQMPIYLSTDIFSTLFMSIDSSSPQMCNKIIAILGHLIISMIPSEFNVDTVCSVVERIKKNEPIPQCEFKLRGSKLLTSMNFSSAERLIKCFYIYLKKYCKIIIDSPGKSKSSKFKETKVWKIFSFLCHHFAILFLYKNGSLRMCPPDEINPVCFLSSYKDMHNSDSKGNIALKVAHEIIKFYANIFEKDETIWQRLEIVDIFMNELLELIEYLGLRNYIKEGLSTVFLMIHKFIKWLGINFMATYEIKLLKALLNLSRYFPPYAFEFQLQQYERNMVDLVEKFEAKNANEVKELLVQYISSHTIGKTCEKILIYICNKENIQIEAYLSSIKLPAADYASLYSTKQYNLLIGQLNQILFFIEKKAQINGFDEICSELLNIVRKEVCSFERSKEFVPKDKFNIFSQGNFYSHIERKIVTSIKNPVSSKSYFLGKQNRIIKTFKTQSVDIVKELFPAVCTYYYYDKNLYKMYPNYAKRVKCIRNCIRIIGNNPNYMVNDTLCSILLKLLTREEKLLYKEASAILEKMLQHDYQGTLKRDEVKNFFFNHNIPKKEECSNPPIIFCRNIRRLMKVTKHDSEAYAKKVLEKIKTILSSCSGSDDAGSERDMGSSREAGSSHDIGPDQLICLGKLLNKDCGKFSCENFKCILKDLISKTFQSEQCYKITESQLTKPILKLLRCFPQIFGQIILESFEGQLFEYLTDLICKHCPKEIIDYLVANLVVPDSFANKSIQYFCGVMKLIYIILRVYPHKSENYLPLKKYIDALTVYTKSDLSSMPLQYCMLKVSYKHVELLCIVYCSLHMENTACLFESVKMTFFYLDFDVTIIRKFYVGKYEYGNRLKIAAPEITKPIRPEIHKKIILDTIEEIQRTDKNSTDHQIYCINILLLPHLNELRKEGDKFIDDNLVSAIINFAVKRPTPAHIQRRLIAAIAIVLPYMKEPDDIVFECLWNNIFYDERTSPKAWSLLGCCLMRKHDLSRKLGDPCQMSKIFTLFMSMMRELMYRHQDIIYEGIDILIPYIFREKAQKDFTESLNKVFKGSFANSNSLESSIKVITIYEKEFSPFSCKILPILWRCFTKLQSTLDNTPPQNSAKKGVYISIYKSLNDAAKTLLNWLNKEPMEGKAQSVSSIINILGKAALKVWEEKEIPDLEIINESYKFQAQFHNYNKIYEESEISIEAIIKDLNKYKPTCPPKPIEKDIYYKLTFMNLCIALSYRCNGQAAAASEIFKAVLPNLDQMSTILQNPKQPQGSVSIPQKQMEIISAFHYIYEQLQSENYNVDMENELYVKIKKDFDYSKELAIEVASEIKAIKDKYAKSIQAKQFTELINDMIPKIYNMIPHIAIKMFPSFMQYSKKKETQKEYMSLLIEVFKNIVELLPTLKNKKEEGKELLEWVKNSQLCIYIINKTPPEYLLKEQIISLISNLTANLDKLEDKKLQAEFIQNACKLAKQCEKYKCPEFMAEVIKIVKIVLNDKQPSENSRALRDHVLQSLREIEYLGTPELEKEVFNCVFSLIQSQGEQNSIYDYIKNPMSLLKYKGLVQRQKFYQLNEKQFGISIVKKMETIFVYMSHSTNNVAKDFHYWYIALSLDLLLHNIDDTQKTYKQNWMLPKITEDNYMADVTSLKDKIVKQASKLRSIKERNAGIWLRKLKKILLQSLCDYSTNKERLSLAFQPMFCSLFQQFWSLLKPSEMQYVNSLAERFIMMQINYLISFSTRKSTMLKIMIETFTSCTPYMKFSPELMQHIGKINSCWHNSLLFLESHAIAFPQNERYYYSLNELYIKLKDYDLVLGLSKLPVANAAVTSALTYTVMGKYDTAKKLFAKIINSSAKCINDEYDIQSNTISMQSQIAKNLVEIGSIEVCKQLSDWSSLESVIKHYPKHKIIYEKVISEIEFDPSICKTNEIIAYGYYELLNKLMKILNSLPKEVTKSYNEFLYSIIYESHYDQPGQMTTAHYSYLNFFQMGVEFSEYHAFRDKISKGPPEDYKSIVNTCLRKPISEFEPFLNYKVIMLYRNKILDSLECQDPMSKEAKPRDAILQIVKEEEAMNKLKIARIARKRDMKSYAWKLIAEVYQKVIQSSAEPNETKFMFYKEFSKISNNSVKVANMIGKYSKAAENPELFLYSTEHFINAGDVSKAENEFNKYLEKKPANADSYKQWKVLFRISYLHRTEESAKMVAVGLIKALHSKPQKHIQYMPFLIECLVNFPGIINNEIEEMLRSTPTWIWNFWVPNLFSILASKIENANGCRWIYLLLKELSKQFPAILAQPLLILQDEKLDEVIKQTILSNIYGFYKIPQQVANLYSNMQHLYDTSVTGLLYEFASKLEYTIRKIIDTSNVDPSLRALLNKYIESYFSQTLPYPLIVAQISKLKQQMYDETVYLDIASPMAVLQYLSKWSHNLKSFADVMNIQGNEATSLENVHGADILGSFTAQHEEPYGSSTIYANDMFPHNIHKYSEGTRFIISATNGKYYEYNVMPTTDSMNEIRSLQAISLMNYYINHHPNTKTRYLRFSTPFIAFTHNLKAIIFKVDIFDESLLSLNDICQFMSTVRGNKDMPNWMDLYTANSNISAANNSKVIKAMIAAFPSHSLTHYIHRLFMVYEDVYLLRKQFIYSWSSNSFMQYMFGTYPTQIKSIFVSLSKGKSIMEGINFVNSPKSILPFRIGKNVEYLMNPVGINGPFRLGILSMAEMAEEHYGFYIYKGISQVLCKDYEEMEAIKGRIRSLWNSNSSALQVSKGIEELISSSINDQEQAALAIYSCIWV